MIIASVFQNYIGKPNARTQFKANIARYSAFNSLNMLNLNSKTHTVEIRLKHGSDDPKEIKEFIDLLTDLFIHGILLKNENRLINLTDVEIDTILALNDIINIDHDVTRTDHTKVMVLVDKLLQIVKTHIMNIDSIKIKIVEMLKLNNITNTALNTLIGSKSDTQSETANSADDMHAGAIDKIGTLEQGLYYGSGGPRKKWVFCYGSNGLAQLKRRVKHKGPWEFRPVVLPKHARIFSASSKGWNGAIASIWPDEKSKVYGMVVKMNAAEIALLDKYEGTHIENWYIQETVYPLDALTGDKYTAMAYINQDIEFIEPPSIEYLQAIEENLKLSGLTKKQVGDSLKINIIDNNTIKLKKIGKWTYGTNKIDFTSKKMAKMFNGGSSCI
jgi:hypothetical protein